ncbi:hypothetical protein, partial [Candidatus Aquicultor secundus]|uniref:hypothetical protein n=1 Tax=Candidatus Aquicultor secundus TaxID=1973895 RepID=UPI000A6EDADF
WDIPNTTNVACIKVICKVIGLIQPNAIKKLVDGANASLDYQTLLGITGSGKTYTIANVIEDNCNLAV